MEEAYEFLKKCGTYYIATMDGDQPRVRPFGSIDVFEGKLYLHTNKKKAVSKQIEKNPKVELCGFAEGKWIRITGTLVRDDRKEPNAHMLEQYPYLKKTHTVEDGCTEVLYFDHATAVFYSFTEKPRTITF